MFYPQTTSYLRFTLSDNGEDIAGFDVVAILVVDGFDLPRHRTDNVIHHFHGFEDHHYIRFLNLVAHFDVIVYHDTWNRSNEWRTAGHCGRWRRSGGSLLLR